MHRFIFSIILVSVFFTNDAVSQEFQAKVSIATNGLTANVDKKIFTTMQAALNDFINNRKWSNETFKQNEKITCNFLLNLTGAEGDNVYKATLIVQAARPVFNSSYQSPLVNFNDQAITFRYIEYQPLDFNENRVQGSEPVAANLSAIFAYYIYVILGLDFDSFALRGGDPYFQKALNIVNNAPESSSISGWKAFDGVRNRYWLIENLTNTKFSAMHDVYYNYFRQGLDQLYDKEADARKAIMNSLNTLNAINTDNPNSMIMQFFFQGRANELGKIFKKGSPDEKSQALDLLTRLDISDVNRYKQDLQ